MLAAAGRSGPVPARRLARHELDGDRAARTTAQWPGASPSRPQPAGTAASTCRCLRGLTPDVAGGLRFRRARHGDRRRDTTTVATQALYLLNDPVRAAAVAGPGRTAAATGRTRRRAADRSGVPADAGPAARPRRRSRRAGELSRRLRSRREGVAARRTPVKAVGKAAREPNRPDRRVKSRRSARSSQSRRAR